MITELLFNILFAPLMLMVGVMPEIKGTVDRSFIVLFARMISSVAYFIPLNSVMKYLIASIMLDITHIVWKIVLRVKSFVPTMGP